jgi:hypothetical protein
MLEAEKSNKARESKISKAGTPEGDRLPGGAILIALRNAPRFWRSRLCNARACWQESNGVRSRRES